MAERQLGDNRWPSLDAISPATDDPPRRISSPGEQLAVPAAGEHSRVRQRAAIEREDPATGGASTVAQANLAGAITQASSQVRAARERVSRAASSLASAQAAADQAQQVVNIVNVSFRAGGATNIEVIDAERSARDADTAVAVVEDLLRRSRLELLLALGRFP